MNNDLLWAALRLHEANSDEYGLNTFYRFDLGNGDTPNYKKPDIDEEHYRVEKVIADALRSLPEIERDEVLKAVFAKQYKQDEKSQSILDSVCEHKWDVRHTFCSLAADGQFSEKMIATASGHESLEVLRKYTHAMKGMQEQVSQHIADTLLPKLY